MDITFDFKGRTAIITGGGRGIGREIARQFAEAGANVVIAARTEAEIEAVASTLTERYDVTAIAVQTNLSVAADITALIETTKAEINTPEILINNAGMNIVQQPASLSVEDVDAMLGVNIRGTFLLTREFARVFRASKLSCGCVINIASLTAQLGVPAMSLYGGTKAGIIGMTRGLAAAYADDGIRVNSVSPGLTRVERTDDVIEEKAGEVFDLDRIPLGRVGDPGDTAKACLFLASSAAHYITGIDLPVDGGVTFTAGLYR